MPQDILTLIEKYARERVEEALAGANGYSGRARMFRDQARKTLRTLTRELDISHDDYWRGE